MIGRIRRTPPILFLLPVLASLLSACAEIRQATTHETFKETAKDAIRSVEEDFNSKPEPSSQATPKTP
jgi:hypothetical protein